MNNEIYEKGLERFGTGVIEKAIHSGIDAVAEALP